METVDDYNEQIDEIDETLGQDYQDFKREHYDAETHEWDSKENQSSGLEMLHAVQDAKRPLQSARDAIINSADQFNEAFSKEIADGKYTALDYTKIDDDFIKPSDIFDLAANKNLETFIINNAKDVAKYYITAKILLLATGTSETPKGVPEGWEQRSTRGKGGTEYFNPKNTNESRRFMPGDPNSQYKNSQTPYVRDRDSSGSFRDVDGNRVHKHSPDGHIPINKWQDKK
ncbi:MAG: hypothetical protein V5783_00845 [Pontiella sp.]